MQIENVFVSINARDFDNLSQWYRNLLERDWDREPVPSCHEWDIADNVFFQVLDNPGEAGKATATFRITDLDSQLKRLRDAGVDAPEPTTVEGFDALRYCALQDPEGNSVGLLEGG
jgi:predicted enzyme related to lactoylglutathione lyase